MEKRFSAVMLSCLFLAACIGSAEAKKIDNFGAGAGFLQFSTASASMGDFAEEMASPGWLFLRGPDALIGRLIAAESSEADPRKASPVSLNEILPGSEEDEDSLADYSIVDSGYAGLLVRLALAGQAAASQPELPAPAAAGEIPAINPRPSYPQPYAFFTPQIITTIRPSGKTPAPAAKAPPRVPATSNPPLIADTSRSPGTDRKPPPVASASPPGQAVAGQPDQKKPQPETSIARYVDMPQSSAVIPITVETPTSTSGDNDIARSTVDTPAPIPEPATMLLFATGIAGFAFNRLRRTQYPEAGNGA